MRKSTYIAGNLVKLRRKNNEKQEFMANYLTLNGLTTHRSTYGAYEQGRIDPCISRLKCLADYFGVSIEDLAFKNLK